MKEALKKYIPVSSIELVYDLFKEYPCKLKIVNNRKTKHGEFQKVENGSISNYG